MPTSALELYLLAAALLVGSGIANLICGQAGWWRCLLACAAQVLPQGPHVQLHPPCCYVAADVAATFKGIIQAIRETAPAIKAANMKLFIRRGGPNYQQVWTALQMGGVGCPFTWHWSLCAVLSQAKDGVTRVLNPGQLIVHAPALTIVPDNCTEHPPPPRALPYYDSDKHELGNSLYLPRCVRQILPRRVHCTFLRIAQPIIPTSEPLRPSCRSPCPHRRALRP